MLVIVASMTLATHSVAEDKELREASDFRVRVAAALRLGKTGGTESRVELEHGLKDPHRAVRIACAAGLVSIGDRTAVPALERALKVETDSAAKTALRDAIAKLRTPPPSESSSSVSIDQAKYVVALGSMKSNTHGGNFDRVMRSAAKSKASTLRGAYVMDSPDQAVFKNAHAKKIPVIILDGTLTQLTHTGHGGGVTVSAHVSMAISTPKAGLKAMVNGNGSASGGALPELQERAIGAAVDGAVGSVTSQIHALAK